MLAGDIVLEAAERDIPLVGVGLLYRGDQFIQKVREDGWQYEETSPFRPESTQSIRVVELHGKPLDVAVHLAETTITVRAYQQRLGDYTTLFYLTTDIAENADPQRSILNIEYCCDIENQLNQQMVLGIGGAKILDKLSLRPSITHFNEGRPIFAHWEMTRQLMVRKKLTFEVANKQVTEKTIYTNHTLVPAGNLEYNTELIQRYAAPYAKEMDIDPQLLVTPGLLKEKQDIFSITQYALNVSSSAQAVSKAHGTLAKKQWPGYKWVAITNGVHMRRWQHRDFTIANMSTPQLWQAHLRRKTSLEREVRLRTGFGYDTSRLVIGWGRRVSAHKRPLALFADIDRLSTILHNTERPVQLLIAGKAHSGDDESKRMIQEIIIHMQTALAGAAIFVPNFDIDLAREMTQGCDVWLNTPQKDTEASGTSGIKALSNGVLNMTVEDGWAAEPDWNGVGWALDNKRVSESIYELLEGQVIPCFYDRGQDNIPIKWVEMMMHSINLARKYSLERMIEEYKTKLYSPNQI